MLLQSELMVAVGLTMECMVIELYGPLSVSVARVLLSYSHYRAPRRPVFGSWNRSVPATRYAEHRVQSTMLVPMDSVPWWARPYDTRVQQVNPTARHDRAGHRGRLAVRFRSQHGAGPSRPAWIGILQLL
jgi:hypothetical protein